MSWPRNSGLDQHGFVNILGPDNPRPMQSVLQKKKEHFLYHLETSTNWIPKPKIIENL